jgi:hypothetical protein
MRDRFLGEEIWQRLGFNLPELMSFFENSEIMIQFRKRLFTRIVPTIKDIGLWGPRIQKAFGDMGVIEYAQVDVEALSEEDENVAAELDRLRRDGHMKSVIAEGAAD